MPHIEIQCFPGRTEEQKTLCAEKVAAVVSETLGCKISSVSVAIRDVPEDQWKSRVWDRCIVADKELLYLKPGYTCENR